MTAPAPCPHCNLPRVTREGAEPACYYCDILPAKRRAAAQRRARGHVVAGVDLDKALAAYRKLPPFKGNLGAIKLRVAHRTAGGTRGTAWPVRRRFRIAAGPDATPERVLEVLVHEMCHLAVPRDTHHGERFRLVFRRACRELWGIDLPLDPPASQGCIAYGMGEIATKALKEKIASGEIDLFPAAPPAPKPTRSERSRTLVEKRAARAAKMLAQAEKNLRSVRRSLAKWRTKVRYYERQAARKSNGG
jgi:hypothetical protein